MKLNALGSIFAARSSLKQLITPAVVPTVLTTFNWWVAKPYQKICFYLMIRMAAFRRARAGVSACIQVQCVRQLLFSEYLLILYMTLQERGNKRKWFFVKVSWRWGDQFLYCVPKSAASECNFPKPWEHFSLWFRFMKTKPNFLPLFLKTNTLIAFHNASSYNSRKLECILQWNVTLNYWQS